MPIIKVEGKIKHLPYPSKGMGAPEDARKKAVKKALKKKK